MSPRHPVFGRESPGGGPLPERDDAEVFSGVCATLEWTQRLQQLAFPGGEPIPRG
jgi:hypothetical protein